MGKKRTRTSFSSGNSRNSSSCDRSTQELLSSEKNTQLSNSSSKRMKYSEQNEISRLLSNMEMPHSEGSSGGTLNQANCRDKELEQVATSFSDLEAKKNVQTDVLDEFLNKCRTKSVTDDLDEQEDKDCEDLRTHKKFSTSPQLDCLERHLRDDKEKKPIDVLTELFGEKEENSSQISCLAKRKEQKMLSENEIDLLSVLLSQESKEDLTLQKSFSLPTSPQLTHLKENLELQKLKDKKINTSANDFLRALLGCEEEQDTSNSTICLANPQLKYFQKSRKHQKLKDEERKSLNSLDFLSELLNEPEERNLEKRVDQQKLGDKNKKCLSPIVFLKELLSNEKEEDFDNLLTHKTSPISTPFSSSLQLACLEKTIDNPNLRNKEKQNSRPIDVFSELFGEQEKEDCEDLLSFVDHQMQNTIEKLLDEPHDDKMEEYLAPSPQSICVKQTQQSVDKKETSIPIGVLNESLSEHEEEDRKSLCSYKTSVNGFNFSPISIVFETSLENIEDQQMLSNQKKKNFCNSTSTVCSSSQQIVCLKQTKHDISIKNDDTAIAFGKFLDELEEENFEHLWSDRISNFVTPNDIVNEVLGKKEETPQMVTNGRKEIDVLNELLSQHQEEETKISWRYQNSPVSDVFDNFLEKTQDQMVSDEDREIENFLNILSDKQNLQLHNNSEVTNFDSSSSLLTRMKKLGSKKISSTLLSKEENFESCFSSSFQLTYLEKNVGHRILRDEEEVVQNKREINFGPISTLIASSCLEETNQILTNKREDSSISIPVLKKLLNKHEEEACSNSNDSIINISLEKSQDLQMPSDGETEKLDQTDTSNDQLDEYSIFDPPKSTEDHKNEDPTFNFGLHSTISSTSSHRLEYFEEIIDHQMGISPMILNELLDQKEGPISTFMTTSRQLIEETDKKRQNLKPLDVVSGLLSEHQEDQNVDYISIFATFDQASDEERLNTSQTALLNLSLSDQGDVYSQPCFFNQKNSKCSQILSEELINAHSPNFFELNCLNNLQIQSDELLNAHEDNKKETKDDCISKENATSCPIFSNPSSLDKLIVGSSCNRTKSEENFTEADKRVRAGMNRIINDKSLLYTGPMLNQELDAQNKKEQLKNELRKLLLSISVSEQQKQPLVFTVRTSNRWDSCIFENNILKLKSGPVARTTKIKFDSRLSKDKFGLILYLLKKSLSLLVTNSVCTQREIYYQMKNDVDSQNQVRIAMNAISSMLNIEPWYFPIVSTSKGLVFGPLTIDISDEERIECDTFGGILIPQDLTRIKGFKSKAYFILIVEKDSIFKKLLDENAPNKLTRPFIMVTGKGFPDINTRLFVRKLCASLQIPVFILVDADPHGIDIMLTYRFGSLNLAHISEQLAVPNARWLGVLPSEIKILNVTRQVMNQNEIKKIEDILKRPYVYENPWLERELQILKKDGFKAEIEGLIKSENYLTNFYLPNKFYSADYF